MNNGSGCRGPAHYESYITQTVLGPNANSVLLNGLSV
jgi:hypothetical protein